MLRTSVYQHCPRYSSQLALSIICYLNALALPQGPSQTYIICASSIYQRCSKVHHKPTLSVLSQALSQGPSQTYIICAISSIVPRSITNLHYLCYLKHCHKVHHKPTLSVLPQYTSIVPNSIINLHYLCYLNIPSLSQGPSQTCIICASLISQHCPKVHHKPTLSVLLQYSSVVPKSITKLHYLCYLNIPALLQIRFDCCSV